MIEKTYILGFGAALPQKCVTNHDLATTLDTTDDWIRERTGITQRYVAGEGETTTFLATAAAQKALQSAGLTSGAIDLVVLATSTPDLSFPATATLVQAALGITHGAAFDLQAACSGFIYALSTAESLLKTGKGQNALVIGVDLFSKFLDWTDRNTAVLFGDGAGAVVLSTQNPHNKGHVLLSTEIFSNGAFACDLQSTGGLGTTQTAGTVQMKGREVFKHAVRTMADMLTPALTRQGLTPSDISWLVPHQANSRILLATAAHLGLPPERVIMTVAEHANTSAASIPLALQQGVNKNCFKSGEIVVLEAFGAGYTWGNAIIRW